MTVWRDTFFQSLYESNYEKMFKFSYRLIGSVESAQDLVHETFFLALFNQSKLSHHPNPEGWLMQTLKNLVQNERRRLQKHPVVSLETFSNVVGEENITSLELLLPKQLTKEEREILIWRYEEQMEYKDIADRLGISEVGCRSRVSRAIAHCKEFLADFTD